ncbi:MAG: hypothetical protein ABI120_14740 [Gemmatimonadaceae bacterium]
MTVIVLENGSKVSGPQVTVAVPGAMAINWPEAVNAATDEALELPFTVLFTTELAQVADGFRVLYETTAFIVSPTK